MPIPPRPSSASSEYLPASAVWRSRKSESGAFAPSLGTSITFRLERHSYPDGESMSRVQGDALARGEERNGFPALGLRQRPDDETDDPSDRCDEHGPQKRLGSTREQPVIAARRPQNRAGTGTGSQPHHQAPHPSGMQPAADLQP